MRGRNSLTTSAREREHLARQQGEHLAESGAIEHRAMLEIDRGRLDEAMALADELVELGGRVRPGAELAARQRASEALATTQAIGRRSDEAFARAVLVDIATRRGESAELDAHRSALDEA